MKKRILRYLKHICITFLLLGIAAVLFGLYHGAALKYSEHPLIYNLDRDGPYVFYKNDSILEVNFIKGNMEDGFEVDKKEYPLVSEIRTSSYFQIDSTRFTFPLKAEFKIPKTTYNDGNPVLAISDIEGGFKTFRDFLMHNKVIDDNLNWTFGKGHLVLLGDFVDRGWSVTQVLWLIYKLEHEAEKKGGTVHFILGNHELKNLQGDYGATAEKYLAVSNILGIVQSDLYSPKSFLGKWLSTKNAVERINGNLFAHGGLHPDIVDTNQSLDQINQIVRNNYYIPYYPKTKQTVAQLLNSTKTGVCWYRGYFKDAVSQEAVDRILDTYQAKTIVVGHTLQCKVNKQYKGKVIAIDIQHNKDYHKKIPSRQSEGLLIEGDRYYRVFSNGKRKEL